MRLYSARDGSAPQTTQMVFPPPIARRRGGISFLPAIPAIGTKFDASAALGPQSQPTLPDGTAIDQTVYLYFGGHRHDSTDAVTLCPYHRPGGPFSARPADGTVRVCPMPWDCPTVSVARLGALLALSFALYLTAVPGCAGSQDLGGSPGKGGAGGGAAGAGGSMSGGSGGLVSGGAGGGLGIGGSASGGGLGTGPMAARATAPRATVGRAPGEPSATAVPPTGGPAGQHPRPTRPPSALAAHRSARAEGSRSAKTSKLRRRWAAFRPGGPRRGPGPPSSLRPTRRAGVSHCRSPSAR